MLILPIKQSWFSSILNGSKKEEYRNIKPYYTARFTNVFGPIPEQGETSPRWIGLRNGYSTKSPTVWIKASLHIGAGREDWGAVPGESYYVLAIHTISPNCPD